jgi:hypothetical protein
MRHYAHSFDESRDEAEIMRIKYRYRQLLLAGKISLPHQSAAKLVGPDCLYHLYSVSETKESRPKQKKTK